MPDDPAPAPAPAPNMSEMAAMADHFMKMEKLDKKLALKGCPNFRRIPGYKVYCCGQPTDIGFKEVLERVCGTIYPKDGKILWLSMRQEPVVYMNGDPFCARPENKIGEFAELGDVDRAKVKGQEVEWKKVVEERIKANDDKFKFYNIEKKELERANKEPVKTLSQVIEETKADFPGLVHMRIPICNSAAPEEAIFDKILSNFVGTSINTPIVISDQLGLSRATIACVIACLFKEFQINASFEGLVETVPGVNAAVLHPSPYTMDPTKDPLFRGEFPVVNALMEKLKNGKAMKNECDKIIDKNGTPKTGGTGIKQIRENIAESKLSYEIMDDSAQAFLKGKIMDNIQKYFLLIVFTAYMSEAADLARNAVPEDLKGATLTGGKCAIPGNMLKIQKSFAAYMDEHKDLRTMIETGKGDLQWERDIPPANLKNLEDLAAKDFKINLGKIIHDIYQTAHIMFSDMPKGDHKKRAKYRFASKTLMRLLPSPIKEEINDLVDRKEMCMDLYEILGKCTWREPAEVEAEEKAAAEAAAAAAAAAEAEAAAAAAAAPPEGEEKKEEPAEEKKD